jgi:aspartate carbamoyltransferase catalytic subunit
VARSNILLLTRVGAEVVVCGPPTLLPRQIESLGCSVSLRLEQALAGADVVMALRLQHERMSGGCVPSLREYARLYGVTEERLRRAAPDVIVMHPGPINRGVELSGEVADGAHSVILEQVTNGVAVRMAVLYLLAGGAPREAAA